MDISVYIHSLITYSHFDTQTHFDNYIQPQVMNTSKIFLQMVEYIAYINCHLQFPNSESPMLSLKRCIRSFFCVEFFSILFSFREMLFVFLGSKGNYLSWLWNSLYCIRGEAMRRKTNANVVKQDMHRTLTVSLS